MRHHDVFGVLMCRPDWRRWLQVSPCCPWREPGLESLSGSTVISVRLSMARGLGSRWRSWSVCFPLCCLAAWRSFWGGAVRASGVTTSPTRSWVGFFLGGAVATFGLGLADCFLHAQVENLRVGCAPPRVWSFRPVGWRVMADRKKSVNARKILHEMLAIPTAPLCRASGRAVCRAVLRAPKGRHAYVRSGWATYWFGVRRGGRRIARPVCLTAHLDHPGFVSERMVRRGPAPGVLARGRAERLLRRKRAFVSSLATSGSAVAFGRLRRRYITAGAGWRLR